MGTTVSPAQAKQWLTATRGTLIALQKIYPLPYSASELPLNALTRSTRNRVLGRLVDKGYIVRIGKPPSSKYVACPDAITSALQDDALISEVLWPSSHLPVFDEVPPPVPPPPAVAVELAPPPPIDNMQRPPQGASAEVIQEWIFTMLHAQTENLIYIREQVDSILNEWRR
jgi:hypothetical protein